MTAALLEVRDLVVEFRQRDRHRRAGTLRAVDEVSFSIGRGETVGLVGESGSGKTTIGRALLGLLTPTSGTIRLDGEDITGHRAGEPAALARRMQVVFQDPFGSLNPSRSVGETLAEPLEVHDRLSETEAQARVMTLLDAVGLPQNAGSRYPFSFSGGQRQRIAIARALATGPELIVCDEAVSALDLVTRAQVVNVLLDLQQRTEASFLFIAHDLPIVTHVSQHTIVLYRGQIMEQGPAAVVQAAPRHPYTQTLLLAVPSASPGEQARRRALRQRLRSTAQAGVPPQQGCPFAPRCPFADEVCWQQRPVLSQFEDTTVACHIYDEGSGHRDVNAARVGRPPTLLDAAQELPSAPSAKPAGASPFHERQEQ